jgi:hypothetical protein
MPPNRFSRERFSEAILDEDGMLYLTEPEPFPYQDLPDNRVHIVVQGDTLWSLAATYYAQYDAPDQLWWILADFQPDPILDPTLALAPGRAIYVPSSRTIDEEILNEARRNAPLE